MKKHPCTVALLSIVFIFFICGTAPAFDVKAGPLYNQFDANQKCPNVCNWYGGWNGNWNTISWATMSVCGCNSGLASDNPYDKNAGPISTDAEAAVRCVSPCQYYGGWAGIWRSITTVMAVCQCNQQ